MKTSELVKSLVTVPGKKGIHLSPLSTFGLRIIVSLIGGLVIALILSAIDSATGFDLMGTSWWLLFGVILAFYLGTGDPLITVPVNHVGVVTFLGERRNIFLYEGEYPWYAKKFFFSVSDTPLPSVKNVFAGNGEEQGFVYLGKRTLEIWNDRKSANTTISLPARGGSTVSVKMTIEQLTHDPIEWMRSNDPILQIAEQARAGLRKTITFFRDTDASGAKSAIAAILSGDTVLTAFTNKKDGSHLVGTMVQDQSGLPMYEIVDVKPGVENKEINEKLVALAKEKFLLRLETEADQSMLKVTKNKAGEIQVAELSIAEKLRPIVEGTGSIMTHVIISDVQLSDKVRQASEAAASEGAQREQQLTSAETQAEVMATLAAARSKHGVSELDQVIAATADGNTGVQVVYVAGSENSIVKAAVAGGKQIGGSK